MKNIKPIITLSLLPLLLTGCVSKGISQDEFLPKKEASEAYLSDANNCPTDIHIQNKGGVEKYDYKEGEFYTYRMFALILIVPVTSGTYTWKEDGKYYHAETHTDSKKNKKSEITEEQFNTYMLQHKAKIMSELNVPLARVNDLLNPNEEIYSSVDNKFYALGDTGWKMISKVSYVDENAKDAKITIEFNHDLPVKYTTKTDSESYYKYELNKATLVPPNFDSTSESN